MISIFTIIKSLICYESVSTANVIKTGDAQLWAKEHETYSYIIDIFKRQQIWKTLS